MVVLACLAGVLLTLLVALVIRRRHRASAEALTALYAFEAQRRIRTQSVTATMALLHAALEAADEPRATRDRVVRRP